MLDEAKSKKDSDDAEFKNSMFGHAFMNQNPDLYKKVYPEDFGMDEEELEELEWIIPQSEEEALAMFNEVVAGSSDPVTPDPLLSLPLLVESPRRR